MRRHRPVDGYDGDDELRKKVWSRLCEGTGFTDVRTYIQSGKRWAIAHLLGRPYG